MEDEDKKGVKILDKRRFDSDGQERSGDKPTKAEVAPAEVSNASAQEETEEATKINFSSFVVSLATQTLMQLGQMKPPPGLDLKPDREAARQTIEILAMLRDKTKGNLDPEETKLFDEILHSLRMAFVKTK